MKQNQYLAYYIRLFLIQFLPNVRGLSENTILAYRDCRVPRSFRLSCHVS